MYVILILQVLLRRFHRQQSVACILHKMLYFLYLQYTCHRLIDFSKGCFYFLSQNIWISFPVQLALSDLIIAVCLKPPSLILVPVLNRYLCHIFSFRLRMKPLFSCYVYLPTLHNLLKTLPFHCSLYLQ